MVYNQGNHTYRGIGDEYGGAAPTIKTWLIRYNNSNSFDVEDNRTGEDKELIELRKKVKQREMENDILKQAALLLGQK